MRICYQRNSSWNAPYTFSGKEKDVETGYGYVKKRSFFSSLAFGNEKQVFHYAHCLRRFGARYYDSGLSIWLSVDPMSDKYPSMSPYNYCANNPVILVDPDGRETFWHPDGNGNLVADKGDNYSTLCEYLSTIYGNIEGISKGELFGFKLQIDAFKGSDIAGLKLNCNNGTFDNLVGKYLSTKATEGQENWGVNGDCSPTTFNRVDLAIEFVYGKDYLGEYGMKNPIYASWNGHSRNGIPLWGSPIINFLGLGNSVSKENFTNGLTCGAIIGLQNKKGSGGHSAIFIKYLENGSGFLEWGHTGLKERKYDENYEYSKNIVRATNFK